MSRPARRTKKAAPHKIRYAPQQLRRSLTREMFCSASHFVGYVEDDESVEAIMKKFQALEEYQYVLEIVPNDWCELGARHRCQFFTAALRLLFFAAAGARTTTSAL